MLNICLCFKLPFPIPLYSQSVVLLDDFPEKGILLGVRANRLQIALIDFCVVYVQRASTIVSKAKDDKND